MPERALRIAVLALALVALVALARADVLVVDAAGTGQYTTIQPAVDAATNGDVVLVKAGTYPGFKISGKGVQVVAHPTTGTVGVLGGITISDTLVAHQVVLIGLRSKGVKPSGMTGSYPGLRLDNVRGSLRVERCVLLGSHAGPNVPFEPPQNKWGSPGCEARGVLEVSFAGCEFYGGKGRDHTDYGHGGHALQVHDGSLAALHDCKLLGGDGGDDGSFFWYTGGGGDALQVTAAGGAPSSVYVSGCTLVGGDGGDNGDPILCPPDAGFGGNGLTVLPGGSAYVQASVLQGGQKGQYACGAPGVPSSSCTSSACTLVDLPGTAREFSGATPGYAGSTVPITFTGEAGDKVALLVSSAGAFDLMLPNVPFGGPLLVKLPLLKDRAVIGTLPASGVLLFPLNLPSIGGLPSTTYYLQLIATDATGKPWLGGPSTLVILDPAF